MLPNKKNKTTQSGNAILFILIAVFLFGALAFSFSRSARDGSSNISKQQAKIAAQEILNYARLVEGAVNRVRRNGCSETEIDFTNPIITHPTYFGAYVNNNSPADKSCHIFEPEGGKITYIKNPPGISSDNIYSFTGRPAVEGVGSSNVRAELLMIISLDFTENNRIICQKINDTLNLGSIEIDNFNPGTNIARFNGTYYNNTVDGNRLTTNNLNGKHTGCLQVAGWGSRYIFYHVLLAR